MIEWLRVCTCGVFLPQGHGESLPTARSGVYEPKQLVSLINRVCLLRPVALGAAELATLKGLVLAAVEGSPPVQVCNLT